MITISRIANIIGLSALALFFKQFTFFSQIDFDYDKHGLKKGDFLVTLTTFQEPKKLGLVLVRNAFDNGFSFKVIKNFPGQYVLDQQSQYFNRVPRGLLFVKGMKKQKDLQYIFISSVVGCRHFKLPQFKSIQ